MASKVVKALPQPNTSKTTAKKIAVPKTLNRIVLSAQQGTHKYVNGVKES